MDFSAPQARFLGDLVTLYKAKCIEFGPPQAKIFSVPPSFREKYFYFPPIFRDPGGEVKNRFPPIMGGETNIPEHIRENDQNFAKSLYTAGFNRSKK